MHINWFEFNDSTYGISIDRTYFDKINLLVGVSGAGKTIILRVLSSYIDLIRKGNSVKNECNFKMNFTVDTVSSVDTYEWSISTTQSSLVDKVTGSTAGYIVNKEELICNGKMLFARDNNKLEISGYNSLPKIPLDKSTIAVFKDDNLFKDINKAFVSVIGLDEQKNAYIDVPKEFYDEAFRVAKENMMSYEHMALYMSLMPLVVRLGIARSVYAEKFNMYMDKLKEIFPYISDVKIRLSKSTQNYVIVLCLQDDVEVAQDRISSGIIKTMNVLAYLYFIAQNALIIVDEVENSLGINCLDDVIESIDCSVYEQNNQAILSSHHPYIINAVDSSKWRIVSQENGHITTKSANEVGIDSKNRDGFFELINFLKRNAI